MLAMDYLAAAFAAEHEARVALEARVSQLEREMK
jgi:hypothetical protein